MLILTRRTNEEIIIGDNIRILVISTSSNQVKLGIEAPKDISVHRREIYDRIKNGEPR